MTLQYYHKSSSDIIHTPLSTPSSFPIRIRPPSNSTTLFFHLSHLLPRISQWTYRVHLSLSASHPPYFDPLHRNCLLSPQLKQIQVLVQSESLLRSARFRICLSIMGVKYTFKFESVYKRSLIVSRPSTLAMRGKGLRQRMRNPLYVSRALSCLDQGIQRPSSEI